MKQMHVTMQLLISTLLSDSWIYYWSEEKNILLMAFCTIYIKRLLLVLGDTEIDSLKCTPLCMTVHNINYA